MSDIRLDPYRRVDLQAPRDGPLALAVCRESLRTATRLERGEVVTFDMADHVFVWGETPLHRFDRTRWFLRDGWGVRPQYGSGDAVMQGPSSELLVPILEPRDLQVMLEGVSAPFQRLSAWVNGRPVGTSTGADHPQDLVIRVPGSALFRGDNVLALHGASGTRLSGVRLVPLHETPRRRGATPR